MRSLIPACLAIFFALITFLITKPPQRYSHEVVLNISSELPEEWCEKNPGLDKIYRFLHFRQSCEETGLRRLAYRLASHDLSTDNQFRSLTNYWGGDERIHALEKLDDALNTCKLVPREDRITQAIMEDLGYTEKTLRKNLEIKMMDDGESISLTNWAESPELAAFGVHALCRELDRCNMGQQEIMLCKTNKENKSNYLYLLWVTLAWALGLTLGEYVEERISK